VSRPRSIQHFDLFLGFAAGLLAAVVCGLVAWVVDDMRGDASAAAEWLSVVVTGVLAYLAWRTARDAALTAKAAHEETLQAEAMYVDFEFLTKIYTESDLPAEAERLPPQAGAPDWPELGTEPHDARIVVKIINHNKRPMREGLLQLRREQQDGPRAIGRIRQGTTCYWFREPREWHSAEPVRRALVSNQAFVDYLEFKDTRGRRWRLLPDGSLREIAKDSKARGGTSRTGM